MSKSRKEAVSFRPPYVARSERGPPTFKSWVADPTSSSAFGRRFTRSQSNQKLADSMEGNRDALENGSFTECEPAKVEIKAEEESDGMDSVHSSEQSDSTSPQSSSDFDEYRPCKPSNKQKNRMSSVSACLKGSITMGYQKKSRDKHKLSSHHDKPIPRYSFECITPSLSIKPEVRINLNPRDIYINAAKYPDSYWQHVPGDDNDPNTCIKTINSSHTLELVTEANIRDQGHITGMTLSHDGTMLATFSTVGVVRIWDLDTFKNIKTLRDKDESYINEFYVGKFLPDTSYLAVAGKLKDPKKWSSEDADNHILPTPIKIFDTITGDIINYLHGHEEEVLCLRAVIYKGENYLITTSQDGYIMKWHMRKGWANLIKSCRMEDGETCMAFNVSFLPNTGNRLFVASCDNHVALFDFETEQKIQKFGELYSCYCDYVMVTPCIDMEPPRFPNLSQFLQNITVNIDNELSQERLESCFAYILSRGVEEVEEIDGVPINTVPNVVCLHKLKYKTSLDGEFILEEVRRFNHPEYRSNSWLIKVDSNGLYVAAPTYEGSVYFFNIATGECTAILRDHEEVEVRDVLFHPSRKLFFSCADDGTVKVYKQSITMQEASPSCEEENSPLCSR